jgi:hypothetical protein
MTRSLRFMNGSIQATRTWFSALALVMLLAPVVSFAQNGGNCTASAGTLAGFKASECLIDGTAAIGGIPVGGYHVPNGYERIFVLTKGEGLVIEQIRTIPIFDVTATGFYTIHTLVYDPSTLNIASIQFGVTTGFDINGLLIQGGGSICGALDVTGTSILVDNPDAGTLTAFKDEDCLVGGTVAIGAVPNGDSYVPPGYSVVYVLTEGPGLVIQQVRDIPIFDVTEPGSYTIHTLVYDHTVIDLGIVELGVTTGFDVNGLLYQGGGNICASLDVPGAAVAVLPECPCEADAGTLSGFKASECLNNGTAAIGGIPNGDAVVPPGYETVFVLTKGAGLVIEEIRPIPIFDVTSTGLYTIHTLVYDPLTLNLDIVEYGVTTGFDVNGLLQQGGGSICGSLDVTGTSILVDIPDAGTVTPFKDEDCLEEGTVAIGVVPNGDSYVPPGYSVIYVLTEGPGLVIQQVRDIPIFDVTEPGAYTIHTLVYDPTTLDLGIVEFGVTTGFDVNGLLYQGGGNICASLDVAGGSTVVLTVCEEDECQASAGTLTLDEFEACLNGDNTITISAISNGDDIVPDGFSVLYVLTKGEELLIVGAGADPSFDITEAGNYTIHTLVYDAATLDLSIVEIGVTTGFDVNALLQQGGGEICASLDVAGAAFVIDECPEECFAFAGTLSADEFEGCLNGDNNVTISATANGDSNVPDGYSVVYVLTQGEELLIVGAGADPSFDITEAGNYTIHTLVYDAATLDLSIVEIGVTTGFDVNALLQQGGGEICASLDVAGAAFVIDECPEECFAFAGTLSADEFEGCLNGDNNVTISATANGDSNVPDGYSVVYVLTQGEELLIVGAGADPSFDITEAGNYTIHTLVYDAATLDLSIVEIGVTTGFDVNALLQQGGGEICASLDVAGAAFVIDECPEECFAFAGTLSADEFEGCLNGDNNVSISATANGDSNVPDGYSVVYVLTQGADLLIVGAGADPSFDITEAGNYTIHTLVYDAATLDLSIVEIGVTTGFDVNALLQQGGGEICASLDVAGAAFVIDECPEECFAFAGTLSADEFEGCLNGDNNVSISATANGDSNVPDGYSVVYVLTQGADLLIVGAGADPSFDITEAGNYTIHTLVYDAATLDLSIVEIGVTTGFDVNALLQQGGGEICASLDVAGAAFVIDECPEECFAFAGTLSADEFEGCLNGDNNVTISATANGDSNVPDGYSVVYVLTQGADLLIVGAGADPSFDITEAGNYTIHTLVYDAATLDLSIVEIGVTTGFDVNALLQQGGGEICASLDVAGAAFVIDECPEECFAFAGTLSADEFEGCLNGDNNVSISATANGDSNVPDGYSVVYVLTQGADLLIVGAGADPSFDITEAGNYTIHTLVYDAATLDLSIVEIGVTTGFDVNALLQQGGGDICASLDVAGAAFVIDVCLEECIVSAGTLTASAIVDCLDGGNSVVLSATPNGDLNAPGGYDVLYLLSFGEEQVIIEASGVPSFPVSEVGIHTIHTLVFNPGTLDLSGAEFGVTTVFEINALMIQGGGEACASLDVTGATFVVVPCENELGDGSISLTAWPSPTVDRLYVETTNLNSVRSELSVWSMQGAMVIPAQVVPADQRMVIDVSNLRDGQYILRLVSGDQVVTQRFVRMD